MLILTGFEPFGKFESNPSWEVAKSIGGDNAFRIHVTYKNAKESAKKIMELHPNSVISLGLDPSTKKLKVEAEGVNVMYATVPDNDGYIAHGEKIFNDGENCYLTDIPFLDLVSYLNSKGIKAIPSFFAGTYVCNTLYYSLLYYQNKISPETHTIFIHIPPSREISSEGWKIEEIKEGVKKAIDFISRLSSL